MNDPRIVPAPLEPGAVVRVIAPASPFEARLVWRGLGWLSERYELRFDRAMFYRHGYLAGSDERRAAELSAALCEPDVGAILCARGGYGVSRIAPRVDWQLLRRHPRWLVGFSDITAAHVEVSRVSVASIHGCHVAALGRADRRARDGLIDALEHPAERRSWTGLEMVHGGDADGPLYGGNLTLLHACAAAGRLQIPPGALLLLEDVTERPYRIDRALTTLIAGGHLDAVAAVLLGEFVGCQAGPDGVSIEQVLRDCLLPLGVPIVAGVPVGHGRINEPFVLGERARLSGATAVVELGG